MPSRGAQVGASDGVPPAQPDWAVCAGGWPDGFPVSLVGAGATSGLAGHMNASGCTSLLNVDHCKARTAFLRSRRFLRRLSAESLTSAAIAKDKKKGRVKA